MTAPGVIRGRLLLALVLSFCIWGSAAGAELQPVDISPPGLNGSGPLIASDGAGTVAAAWRELDGDSASIRAAFRPRGGEWTSKRISVPSHSVESPAIAMDRLGNAVAVWQRSNGRDSVIQAAVRPAEGDWSAPQDLSLLDEPAFDADVDVQAGNMTAVWVVLRERHTVLMSSSRTVGGAWSPPVTVAGPDGDPTSPAVALDDHGGALAAWHWWDGAHRVVAAAAKPGGETWSPPVVLSTPGQSASRPQLVMDADGDAVAGWIRSNGDWNVPQVASRSSAGQWVLPANLSNRSGSASGLELAMSRNGHAVAAWKQGGRAATLWSSSRAPDATRWSERTPIAESWVRMQTDIALDEEGNVTAVWSSSYTVSASFKPIGKPWQDDYLLSDYDAHAVRPAVATHGPRVATALWMQAGEQHDRIQFVSYDIETSAKEAEDEDEDEDEGDEEDGEEIMGTARADRLVGTPGNDVFHGLRGNDTIIGRGGRDIVFGGLGNDRIIGGSGSDRLFGGPGRDVMVGGRGRDFLAGEEGRDRLFGGRGADVLVGGTARDLLSGNAGNDTIRARDGRSDRVSGGRGLDGYSLDRWLDHARSIETRLR